ncbi:MAG: CBS domain-containing protein [Gammaproteobacteria bacterium]
MKTAPQLRSLMTPFPYSVAMDDSVSRAQALMGEHGVRHLPVREGEAIAGIVTDSDILVAQVRSAAAGGGADVSVREVCTLDPYVVSLDEPLENVLSTMSERRIGSAIVTHHGRLAGVFTATDACRAFGDVLREWFAVEPDPEAA